MEQRIIDQCKSYSDHGDGFEILFQRIEETIRELPDDFRTIEIGTRAGGSALLLMHAISGHNRVLISVDPYGKEYKSGGMWPEIGEDTYKAAMSMLFEKSKDLNVIFVPYRMTSLDFMVLFEKTLWVNNKTVSNPYGIVYLDGEHVDEVVLQEYLFFKYRLHSKGLIVIDDVSYLMDSKLPEIQLLTSHGQISNNRLYLKANPEGTWPL